ncbi:unannotated protein [freshwater metagenome]|uniref:Unannotated protein n=1 Tax=freshwater metagenome TaxID=449393 RepID=A0A6J7EED1_9ZZZZ
MVIEALTLALFTATIPAADVPSRSPTMAAVTPADVATMPSLPFGMVSANSRTAVTAPTLKAVHEAPCPSIQAMNAPFRCT